MAADEGHSGRLASNAALFFLLQPLLGCAHSITRGDAAWAPEKIVAGVATSMIDQGVSPCDDFYAYACGGWLARTHLTDDEVVRSRRGSVMVDRNDLILRRILEADAAGQGDPRDPNREQLGTFWASCMNEAEAEKTALPELQQLLAPIDGITNTDDLARVLASFQARGISPFFAVGSVQNPKDAHGFIGRIADAPTGLRVPSYYFENGEKAIKIREAYESHVAAMFRLAGASRKQAREDARAVVETESALASWTLGNAESMDSAPPQQILTLEGLKALAPNFPWTSWLVALGAPQIKTFNLENPKTLELLNEALSRVPLIDVRPYMRWRVIDSVALQLSPAFFDEHFRMWGGITGRVAPIPRWKLCILSLGDSLTAALGPPFVRQTLTADDRHRVKSMVEAIRATLVAELGSLPWLDVATRLKATEKLARLQAQIGYPEPWPSFDVPDIAPVSFLENRLRAQAFEVRRNFARIGKPFDSNEWTIAASDFNASYRPAANQVVLPAGNLQPPTFNGEASEAANYGSLGAEVGHELLHAFDQWGRSFDGNGNRSDGWGAAMEQAMTERAACVQRQAQAGMADDTKENATSTAENVADLGGLSLAYRAYEASRSEARAERGYSPEQQFFLSYAQSLCEKERDAFAQLMLRAEPHATAHFRVNGPLSNLAVFQEAFGCKEGQKMVRAAPDRCAVW